MWRITQRPALALCKHAPAQKWKKDGAGQAGGAGVVGLKSASRTAAPCAQMPETVKSPTPVTKS